MDLVDGELAGVSFDGVGFPSEATTAELSGLVDQYSSINQNSVICALHDPFPVSSSYFMFWMYQYLVPVVLLHSHIL